MQGIQGNNIRLRLDGNSENIIICIIIPLWTSALFVYCNLLCSVMNFCDSFGYYSWNKDKKMCKYVVQGQTSKYSQYFPIFIFCKERHVLPQIC